MDTLLIKLGPAVIQIDTDDTAYFAFAKLFFQKVTLTGGQKPDVRVRMSSTAEKLTRLLQADKPAFVEAGASTLVGEKELVTIRKIEGRKKAYVRIGRDKECLTAEFIFQRKPFKDFWRKGVCSGRQDEWFFTLTYHLVYYPALLFLETFKGISALHASAFSYKDKGIVICGLESIGKTSLSLMFLKKERSKFLSDNLVFFDKEKVYSCYELVRISKNEREDLWEEKFDHIRAFDIPKNLFSPKFEPEGKGARPDVFIFPCFGPSFHLKEIPARQAASRAMALSYIPSELRNYSEYRHLFCLLDFGAYPPALFTETLAALLSSSRCLCIQMNKKDGLKENFQKVRDAIEHG